MPLAAVARFLAPLAEKLLPAAGNFIKDKAVDTAKGVVEDHVKDDVSNAFSSQPQKPKNNTI